MNRDHAHQEGAYDDQYWEWADRDHRESNYEEFYEDLSTFVRTWLQVSEVHYSERWGVLASSV